MGMMEVEKAFVLDQVGILGLVDLENFDWGYNFEDWVDNFVEDSSDWVDSFDSGYNFEVGGFDWVD